MTDRAHAAPDAAGFGRAIPMPAGRRFRPSGHSLANRATRGLWGVVWLLLFRPTPKAMHGWRRTLLRLFGARIGRGASVHPSARIWAPWNLRMGDFSCLSPDVDCYAVDEVSIGPRATVSQYSFLCTAGHDIDTPELELVTAPIAIGEDAWIAADVFVAPGVMIGEGAVVGARSSVFKDVPAWTVVVGSPARHLRHRSPSHAATGRGGPG